MSYPEAIRVPGLRNLIVAEGKTRLAQMLTGESAGSFVKWIAMGTSSSPARDSDRYSAIKAETGRILIELPVAASLCPGVFSISDPDTLETPPVARFTATLDYGQLVGATIGELMLVFEDKTVMLARKSLGGGISRGPGWTLVVNWFIVIS